MATLQIGSTQINLIRTLTEISSANSTDVYFIQRGNNSFRIQHSNINFEASRITTSGSDLQTELNNIASRINWIDSQLTTINGSIGSLDSVPVGTVTSFSGNLSAIPSGYLECNGQTVSQATYPNLYSLLGTIYGPDSGGNFTLPDYTGRGIAGVDNMGTLGSANRLTLSQTNGIDGSVLANTGGEETHILTNSEMSNHAHTYDEGQPPFPAIAANNAFSAGTQVLDNANTSTGSAGNDEAHNNVQPTTVMYHIIKT